MSKSLQPSIKSYTAAPTMQQVSTNYKPKLKEGEVLIDTSIFKEIITEVVRQTTQLGTVVEIVDTIKWLKNYNVTHTAIQSDFVIISKTTIYRIIKQHNGALQLAFIELNKKVRVTQVVSAIQHTRKSANVISSKPLGFAIAVVGSKIPAHLIKGKTSDAVGELSAVSIKFFVQEYLINKIGVEAAKRVILQATSRLILTSAGAAVGTSAALAAFTPAVAGVIGVITISIAVNYGIEWLDEKTKFTKNVIEISREIGTNIEEVHKRVNEKGGVYVLEEYWRDSDVFKELQKIPHMQPHHWMNVFKM